MEKNGSTKNENKKEIKKENIIFAVVMAILFIVLIIGNTITINNNYDDTYKIANEITKELKKEYSKISFVEEEINDKNKFECINSSLIFIGDIDNKYAISIKKYTSNAEASKKEEFIKNYNKLAHEKFDNTLLTELGNNYDNIFKNDIVFVRGKYLFSINSKITKKAKIKKIIDKVIKKYDISDIDIIDRNELNKYWNDKLKKSEEELNNTYNKKVENIKKQILKKANNIKNCSTIAECKKIIESKELYEKYDILSEEYNKFKEEYQKKIIVVIDFSTMTRQEAENWCKEREITCNIEEEYSDAISENGLISQSKEANTEILKEDDITITYSIGKRPTQSQLNALRKAQSYSDYQHMSKNRLYSQLTSKYGEGFSSEDAQYAIDHVKADWNYNALQTGKSYYKNLNMSKSRVYQQLVSSYGEDFTPEQAQYAIDHLDD